LCAILAIIERSGKRELLIWASLLPFHGPAVAFVQAKSSLIVNFARKTAVFWSVAQTAAELLEFIRMALK
jgi:hypothetical protein